MLVPCPGDRAHAPLKPLDTAHARLSARDSAPQNWISSGVSKWDTAQNFISADFWSWHNYIGAKFCVLSTDFSFTVYVFQSMQLSYDYAKDRALMCLRANYESHLISSNPYMALCLVDNGNDIVVRKSLPRYSNTGLVTDIWCACPSSFGEVIMTGGMLCFLPHVL